MMRIYFALIVASGFAAPSVGQAIPAEKSAQLNCDALSVERPLDNATLRDLGPAHSLEAAATVLTRHGVKFQRRRGTMLLTSVTPKMMREIDNLPQGEPIILPDGEGHTICVLLPSDDSI